ncbi:MAG: tyrosine-type recombinase/integrase [Desulfobacteraceae bacterium]|nr:tyrosine-type recombinase/integrase [Desulfobacteraceae bacterium]
MLKRNSNARERILALDEFKALMDKLPRHTKAILATGFYTGMRRGEVLSLTWDKVDMEKRVIQLEARDTKDKEPRTTPLTGMGTFCEILTKPLTKRGTSNKKADPLFNESASCLTFSEGE